MKRTCKIALFVLMVIIALASLTACGNTKLDVADGVTVVFSGADGNGYAELIHDEENPSEMVPKFLLKLVKDKKVAADDWQKLMTIGSAVSYDLDKSSKLSNGDTVTVTISVDNDILKNYKMKAEPTKLTFKVKGLAEVKPIKPFKNFEITFDGISPNAQVKDYTRSEEIEGATVNYQIDTTSNLREGQELTVTATLSDNTYYKLSEDTMNVTVSDVDKYIFDLSELQSSTLDTMKRAAEENLESYIKNWNYVFPVYNYEYIGCELWTPKEGHRSQNAVYLYYKINLNVNGSDSSSYFYYGFHSIVEHPDGTQEVDMGWVSKPFINVYDLAGEYSSMEFCISDAHKLSDSYDIQQKFN